MPYYDTPGMALNRLIVNLNVPKVGRSRALNTIHTSGSDWLYICSCCGAYSKHLSCGIHQSDTTW